MFFKYFLSLFLTLFLGPGVGHLVLREYKKAIILIGIAVSLVIITAVMLMASIDISAVPQDYEATKEFLKELISKNTDKMIIIDLPLAGLWAYAFVDIIMTWVSDYRKNGKQQNG